LFVLAVNKNGREHSSSLFGLKKVVSSEKKKKRRKEKRRKEKRFRFRLGRKSGRRGNTIGVKRWREFWPLLISSLLLQMLHAARNPLDAELVSIFRASLNL